MITHYLAPNLRMILERQDFRSFEEIRIRLNRPLMAKDCSGYFFLSVRGQRTNADFAYNVTADDLERTLQLITKNSWYAWEQEILGGYVTLPGGHRVGLAGRAVYAAGLFKTIKNISALNFRQAHEIIGVANPVIKQVIEGNGNQVLSTLIVSPPGCGKTTLLRDLTRQVANAGFQVTLIDERSEIAASHLGVPQLDVGCQTDVLDGYDKETGVYHTLRGLGPEVVVTDEIAQSRDSKILAELARGGVKIIASCHGESLDQLRHQGWVKESLAIFELIVILSRRSGPGSIESVLRLQSPS